ncbi:MAG: ABC-type transport auxiliary lipoprotein family protein [Rhodospirillales bacterium]
MTRPRLLWTIAALAFAPVLLGGCSGLFGDQPPLEFYTLSAKSEIDGEMTPRAGPAASGPILRRRRGAGAAVQPALDRRPQQSDAIDLADNDVGGAAVGYHRLGAQREHLDDDSSDRVVELPVSAAVPVDYELRVEIVRFEREPNGAVDLVARWSVFSEGGQRLIAIERSSYRASDVADDFRSITLAMSALLGELSSDIANTLRTVSTPAPSVAS